MSDGKSSKHRCAAYIINARALDVLLEYAQGTRKHEAWCFTAADEEHLERQIPDNEVDEVDACPVCDAVFEVQQRMRADDANYEEHMDEVRGRFLRNSQG